MSGGKVGAPKGGRVHWLLLNLTSALKRAYTVRYDYDKHRYAFFRYPNKDERKKPIDLFIVVRTSERCWRVMYYHFEKNYFKYESAQTSSKAVEVMQDICNDMSAEEKKSS